MRNGPIDGGVNTSADRPSSLVISPSPVQPGSRVNPIGAPTECIQGVRSGNPYIVLENLMCACVRNADLLRSIYVLRRQIWLDRVEGPDEQSSLLRPRRRHRYDRCVAWAGYG